jgi:hypothetical protein
MFPVPSIGAEVVPWKIRGKGLRLRQQATGRRPALACDLCTVTGCPARGDGWSALAGLATRATAGHWSRRGAGQRRAAAAAPAGLLPGRARQRCRPQNRRMPATPVSDGGMPRRSGARVASNLRTRCGPWPSAAGAAGALEAVLRILTSQRTRPGSRSWSPPVRRSRQAAKDSTRLVMAALPLKPY